MTDVDRPLGWDKVPQTSEKAGEHFGVWGWEVKVGEYSTGRRYGKEDCLSTPDSPQLIFHFGDYRFKSLVGFCCHSAEFILYSYMIQLSVDGENVNLLSFSETHTHTIKNPCCLILESKWLKEISLK